MMAGLCCGEPCTISWEIIRPGAAAFLSCSDEYSAMGMRLLGRPEQGDPAVVSGESGAVGVGALSAILHEEKLEDLRWSLGLNESSRGAVCQHGGGHRPGPTIRRSWGSGADLSPKPAAPPRRSCVRGEHQEKSAGQSRVCSGFAQRFLDQMGSGCWNRVG